MSMCGHGPDLTFENILADALVRLVMASDGVSEAELRLVLENARRAVAARDFPTGFPRYKRSPAAPHTIADARAEALLCEC
jgi:hypothetical protein